MADNGKFIFLCIIIKLKPINYRLIIPRQIAFNKHVLKDYLATAVRAIEFIQHTFENCLPETAQRIKTIMKKRRKKLKC